MAEVTKSSKSTETVRVKGEVYVATFTVDGGTCESVWITDGNGRPMASGLGSVPAHQFPDLVDVLKRTYEVLTELAVTGGEVEAD